MPHLYCFYGDEFAFVSEYKTYSDAENAKRVNDSCYADEGFIFAIYSGKLEKEPTSSFFHLLHRYSK